MVIIVIILQACFITFINTACSDQNIVVTCETKYGGPCDGSTYKGNVVIAYRGFNRDCECISYDTCVMSDQCDNDFCVQNFGDCYGQYNGACDCIPTPPPPTTPPATTTPFIPTDCETINGGPCNDKTYKGNVVIAGSYFNENCECISYDSCVMFDQCDNDFCVQNFGDCYGQYNGACDCIPTPPPPTTPPPTTTPSHVTTTIPTTTPKLDTTTQCELV